jgi:hypothetical protein
MSHHRKTLHLVSNPDFTLHINLEVMKSNPKSFDLCGTTVTVVINNPYTRDA